MKNIKALSVDNQDNEFGGVYPSIEAAAQAKVDHLLATCPPKFWEELQQLHERRYPPV